MDFELSENHQAIRDAAVEYARKRILPQLADLKKKNRFPRELLQEMAELGFFGCTFPEKYGGTETGFLSQALIAEEIARVLFEVSFAFNMQCMTCPFTILNWGNDQQRDQYVADTIACRKIGYFGLTEPNAASDAAAIQTTAQKQGDSYILNGSKIWITYAPFSDYGIIFARTAEDRYHGLSCFIVPSDLPGVKIVEMRSKFLSGLSSPGEIYFDDCRLPAENLLGEEGQGFAILSSALNYGRLTVAARSLGIGQACLDEMLFYADNRMQFQQKIGRFQSVKALIAEAAVELEAARMMVYRNGWLKDRGKTAFRESAYSKYFASEVTHRAAEAAMKIHGAYSFHDEYRIGDLYIAGAVVTVAEGSSFIQRGIIADDALSWKDAERYAGFDKRYPVDFSGFLGR
ncbi:MAG: acyl-CoA dehydrogenase family protein [bacterium]